MKCDVVEINFSKNQSEIFNNDFIEYHTGMYKKLRDNRPELEDTFMGITLQ